MTRHLLVRICVQTKLCSSKWKAFHIKTCIAKSQEQTYIHSMVFDCQASDWKSRIRLRYFSGSNNAERERMETS